MGDGITIDLVVAGLILAHWDPCSFLVRVLPKATLG